MHWAQIRAFQMMLLSGLVGTVPLVDAAAIISDGTDGPFNGGGALNLDADGIFNFTTITVPEGLTLSFVPNLDNTPVILAATGDVTINGTISVSAGHFSGVPGPGGGSGGAAGANGAIPGESGSGPAGGPGGPPSGGIGNAGGGGAMATDGLQATSRTGGNPAPGAGAIGFPGPSGGSGGGGGSGGWFFGVGLGGGVGGGAGGGLLITTPGDIIVNGSILANGGHAGWGFANVFAFAGPGGGGSGGNVILEGAGVSLGASAVISAIGGAGGGLSTETAAFDPFFFSNGAHGGDGYVLIDAAIVDIDPDAIIDGTFVPVPAALPLLVAALAVVGCWHRKAA